MTASFLHRRQGVQKEVNLHQDVIASSLKMDHRAGSFVISAMMLPYEEMNGSCGIRSSKENHMENVRSINLSVNDIMQQDYAARESSFFKRLKAKFTGQVIDCHLVMILYEILPLLANLLHPLKP